MVRFLIRRLLLTIPVLLGVATLVFSLIHLVPGDPAQAMLGDGASPQDVAELRTNLGLDQALLSQYASFLRSAMTGDLGTSFRTGQPVTRMIAERLPIFPNFRSQSKMICAQTIRSPCLLFRESRSYAYMLLQGLPASQPSSATRRKISTRGPM